MDELALRADVHAGDCTYIACELKRALLNVRRGKGGGIEMEDPAKVRESNELVAAEEVAKQRALELAEGRGPLHIEIPAGEVERRVQQLSFVLRQRAKAAKAKRNKPHLVRAECFAVYVFCRLMVEESKRTISPENLAKLDELIDGVRASVERVP